MKCSSKPRNVRKKAEAEEFPNTFLLLNWNPLTILQRKQKRSEVEE